MRSSSFFAGIVSEPACDVAERERRDAVTLTPACSTCSTAACIVGAFQAGQSPRTGTAARRARAIALHPSEETSTWPPAAVAFHRREAEPGDRRIVQTVRLAQPQKPARRLNRRQRVVTTAGAVRLVNLHLRIRFPPDGRRQPAEVERLGNVSPDVTGRPRSHVRQQDVSQDGRPEPCQRWSASAG